MIRKRYLFPIIIVLIVLTWALQTPAADNNEQLVASARLSVDEQAALAGAEPPQTLAEKVLDAVDDDTVVVRSVDGRTVLMLEGEPNDEFSISFSDVVDGVAANVKLGKGGLKHRFTLVKPEGSDPTPIYLDLVGPAVNGGLGVKITIRF
jgi:hypothetical protein